MNNNTLPFDVSVCMICYNHEKFIAKAIESILSQKTNIRFELIIGDDFSTDKTIEICRQYQQKHSEIIRLLPSGKNMGMSANFTRTLQAAGGKYIALCEGDDYWTDPYKLQKQFGFLESNPEYAICFHNSSVSGMDDIKSRSYFIYLKEGAFTYKDFLANDSFPLLSSILYKNDSLILQPLIKNILKARDIILILLILEKGDAYYIDELMSNRRLHHAGVWSSLNSYDKLLTQITIRKEYLKYYRKHTFSKALSKNLINKLIILNTFYFKKLKVSNLILNTITIFYYSIMFGHIKYLLKSILKNLVLNEKNN